MEEQAQKATVNTQECVKPALIGPFYTLVNTLFRESGRAEEEKMTLYS